MLETARLRLLPWVRGDEPLLTSLATHPTVVRYITDGVPWTVAEVAAFVKDTGTTVGLSAAWERCERLRIQKSAGGWRRRTGALGSQLRPGATPADAFTRRRLER